MITLIIIPLGLLGATLIRSKYWQQYPASRALTAALGLLSLAFLLRIPNIGDKYIDPIFEHFGLYNMHQVIAHIAVLGAIVCLLNFALTGLGYDTYLRYIDTGVCLAAILMIILYILSSAAQEPIYRLQLSGDPFIVAYWLILVFALGFSQTACLILAIQSLKNTSFNSAQRYTLYAFVFATTFGIIYCIHKTIILIFGNEFPNLMNTEEFWAWLLSGLSMLGYVTVALIPFIAKIKTKAQSHTKKPSRVWKE